MAITLITPHQRQNSGGVDVITRFARHAATLTEVNVVVAKGQRVPIEGARMYGPDALATLTLPQSDALVIPADMRHAEHLFGLPPDKGAPMLLFQGYGTPGDPVVRMNLVIAQQVICNASWLVGEAVRAGCEATLVRVGLDRDTFSAGPPARDRGPVVGMMTHWLDWKATADGLEALRLAREEVPELEVRLFGKLDPSFPGATFMPSPNEPRQVAALMRQCSVFVVASWEEGLGLPGIEAITSGAALATTDTKGSRDYAVHGRTALVSEPRDPAALARNIVTLARDAELRARLIDAGRQHIEATFPNWQEAAERFVAAVHEAAGTAVAAPRASEPPAHDTAGAPGDLKRALELVTSVRYDVQQGRTSRLAEARRRIAELEAGARTAEREQRQVRSALESELEELRARLREAKRNETGTRRELAEMSAELELANAQRRRLQAALARARADAQIAEAERAAFERRVLELSEIVEGEVEDFRAPDLPAAPLGSLSDAEEAFALAALPVATRTWPPLPASEHEAQEIFLAEYRRIVDGLAPDDGGRDPLALPIAADVRGMLATASAGQELEAASVDVVVCVHDALEDVRDCLWSLLHKATRPFRLIVVDDGSEPPTASFLADVADRIPAVTLISRDQPPHGYTLAANAGLRASSSDYVVLLNSDTIVSYGWLERIVEYGERHERIGILGPLSNAATHQSVPAKRQDGEWATNPLPDWLTVDGMALLLQRASPRTDTRLPFINGFCYVIRRPVIDAIGYFDEDRFPEGYAEENDYSQRARSAGFELGVVDDAYVFHAKSRSYGVGEGKQISRRGYEVFLDKHGREEINRIVREMEADTMLDPVRGAIGTALASPDATAAALANGAAPGPSVTFVLPGLAEGGSGGSHSIYQEVRGLRRLGIRAQIALHERAWERAQAVYDDAEDVFETFADGDELARLTVPADVIVATHFKAVAMVAAIRRQRDDFLPAYYVQDYEPMFKFADPADYEEAAGSYTAIADSLLFAKTHWLCNVVSRRHNVFVAKVEPSIDEQLYRPDDSSTDHGPPRVVAMIRPRTPRRQPFSTTAVLEQLLDALPGSVEVATFGCRDDELARVASAPRIREGHLGLLKREQVAALLRRSDLFLDMSTYQAFGRTALEAMACGCAAVVPRLGGVWEFASDGENLLAVDTLDPEAALEAVASVIHDRERLAGMRAAAQRTASRYSIMRAALSEYTVLRYAYEARFG